MRIENEKTIINVDIFNKKKFEISYREYNEEVVHNKQTFVYEIGVYFNSKVDNSIEKYSIVITQECLEKTQYQPLKFTQIFLDQIEEEYEAGKIYKREIKLERKNFNRLLLEKQTIECSEVNYENFEYYSQCVNINPNQNIYLQVFLLETIEKIEKELNKGATK